MMSLLKQVDGLDDTWQATATEEGPRTVHVIRDGEPGHFDEKYSITDDGHLLVLVSYTARDGTHVPPIRRVFTRQSSGKK